MRNSQKIISDGDAAVATRPYMGGYHGQVIVRNRSYSEPLVLHECRHTHRSTEAAERCATFWIFNRANNK